jgi:hypothetical protein
VDKKLRSFLYSLSYLGGRLSSDKEKSFSGIYVDLESFFIESTLYAGIDSRLCRTLEHWVNRFGILLSPSKVRRILKILKVETEYNPYILGAWIQKIIQNKRNQNNWNIVKCFSKKYSKKVLLFKNNPHPKNPDSIFLKQNILAPNFKEEEKKYLKNLDFIVNNSLEIKSRIISRNQVLSDIISVKQKLPDLSLYKIAKITHSDISRVVKENQFLNYFKIAV